MPLVDELENAEEIFFEGDWNREDRFRAVTALLVPALIEAKVRMVFRELGLIVRILDIDGLAREGCESGDRGERFRHADFLRNVADLLHRIQFLVLRVDRV